MPLNQHPATIGNRVEQHPHRSNLPSSRGSEAAGRRVLVITLTTKSSPSGGATSLEHPLHITARGTVRGPGSITLRSESLGGQMPQQPSLAFLAGRVSHRHQR